MTRLITAVALAGLLAALTVAVAAATAPLKPRIAGEWWTIATDPDLGALTEPKQQPVDFAIWQAADSTWQLWSCIRATKEPGKTRLFHRWESARLRDKDWQAKGVAMHADPAFGETQGGLQAPYVFKHDGKYWMLYGDWVSICLAASDDGKTFTRCHGPNGKPQLFGHAQNDNARDPMVLRVGGKWHCYYTAHPERHGSVYARTSTSLIDWSEARIVAARGQAGDGPYSAECPFVVEPQPGHFFLLRTQRYGTNAQTSVYHSRDPLDFGIDNDAEHFVGTLPVAAPEIFQHEGAWFIAALLPSLKGIQIARLDWAVGAEAGPYLDGRFKGRIAYSADGNHNDPDDWAASPVALAIFAEAGLKDRLVHFDYNCILPETDTDWEKKHAESVLGAARRYGYDQARFFDCRKDLDGAVASIVEAINASGATDPLYFIIAGPMEVPFRAIEKSDSAKRQFVFCISHSRWNDGYAANYKFTFTKRSVIEQDVHWTQIRDQNERLSFGRYGRPSPPEEFAPYFWMRDSRDAKVRFLWERMVASTRPDPSDAGMAWFLATGDEECDPAKLKRLLDEHHVPPPTLARRQVRLEAENFRHLEGFVVEDRKDKDASHQLNILATGNAGRIHTRIDEPFMSDEGRYDVVVRHREAAAQRCRYTFFINGVLRGVAWDSAFGDGGWTNQTIRGVELRIGDEIRVDVEGTSSRLDYVQLNLLNSGPTKSASKP